MKLILTTITLVVLSLGAFAQLEVPVPYNPDGNADGFISLRTCLISLLIRSEYSPEELATDSSSAIIYIGQGDYFDCASSCAELEELEGDGRDFGRTLQGRNPHYDNQQQCLDGFKVNHWPTIR